MLLELKKEGFFQMYKTLTFLFMLFAVLTQDGPVYVEKIEDAFIESKQSNKDLLIVFSADWCSNCVSFKKHLMEDNSSLSNMVVCIIDFDSNTDLVKEYSVKKIPDFRYYRNSTELSKKIGYSNKEQFTRWILKNSQSESTMDRRQTP